ncbi:MAG: LAGLIDADG family homing endonuclease [Candidatus Aenigmatarchaeota archaeon]
MPEVIVGRDEEDTKKYGTTGTLFIGRHLVGTGEDTHMTTPVLLDVLRPHIISISGKRGEGKCTEASTLITLADGSCVPIKDLAENNSRVVSLNDELKITTADKSEFYKRTVDKIVKIRMRSGKEIKLTPEHPLFTIKGWKPANELGIGSRIATPREINVFGSDTTPLSCVKILAYLIAEGNIRQYVNDKRIGFTNFDDKITEEFRNCVEEFSDVLRVITYPYRKDQFMVRCKNVPIKKIIERNGIGHIVKIQKNTKENPLVLWLEKIGVYGALSKDKIIPDFVFRLPKEEMKIFLNRLFSCDGTIYLREGLYEISYSSSSERLIRSVQHLLLRFGVVSKLKNRKIKYNGKEFASFELMIRGEFVKSFIKEIGFFGAKEIRAEKALAENVKRNTNIDTIPKEVWDFFQTKNWANIGRAFNYAYPKAMRESVRYSPSREKLLQIAKIENHEGLRALAESDIFWDEIISIELLEGSFEVYDISVPEYHNFVANDIIVHNSFTMGVIMEEMMKLPPHIKKNLCGIIIDTQGIYWTMKSASEKDAALLKDWDMKPSGFNVDVYVPEGQEKTFRAAGVDFDETFSFAPSEISAEDWLGVFDLNPNEPLGILLQRSVTKLTGNYSIDDIIKSIKSSEGFENEKLALENRFEAAKSWGIFGSSRVPPLLEPGKMTILDISLTPQNVRALLVGLTSKKIFLERVEARRKEELAEIEITTIKRTPMPWIFIDEAHNFLPSDGITAATESLNRIVKEGRQPGITLVLATQRPEKLHPDALAQTDMIISHRLTAKNDVEALKAIMQTYLLYDIGKYINELPKLKGVAIILDDNSERLYKVRIRPRQSWHAGSSPVAI